MTGAPRVSVVMTTYNGEALVAETVSSILTQSLADLDLIVVDDASTDGTLGVLTGFRDPRLRIHRNPANLGVAASRNMGLALAHAEYVAMTDQDDVSLPERLEHQVAYLHAHPDTVLVASAARERRGRRLRSVYAGETRPHVVHWRMFSRGGIVHSSVCIRRRVLEESGIRYDPEYRYADDLLLFHRLAELGDVVVLPEELVVYREHAASNSRRHDAEMVRNGERVLHERYRDYLGMAVTAEEVAAVLQVFCIGHLCPTQTGLVAVGRTYRDALLAFEVRTRLARGPLAELRLWASRDWWRVVAAHARGHGRLGWTRAYDAIPELASFRPGALARAGLAARAWRQKVLGRRWKGAGGIVGSVVPGRGPRASNGEPR